MINEKYRKTGHVRFLSERIEESIRQNGWTEKQVLPSVRQLAAEFNVSRETARRAMKTLAARGIVEAVHGSGTVLRPAFFSSPPPSVAAVGFEGAAHAVLSRRRACRLNVASCEFTAGKNTLWALVARAFEKVQAQTGSGVSIGLREVVGLPPAADVDLVHTSNQELSMLGRAGQLLNLHPLIARNPRMTEGLFPGLERYAAQDPCWAMPVAFDIEVACLNRDRIPGRFLERLDASWRLESLAGWAADLARKTGLSRPVSFPRPHMLMSGFGVDVVTAFESLTARARTLAAFESMRECHRRYPFYTQDIRDVDVRVEDQKRFFAEESVLVFQHTFDLPRLRHEARFDWEVRPFPQPFGGIVRCWPLGCGISRQCLFPEEAFAFIQFLCEPGGQAIMASGKNNLPVKPATLRLPVWSAPPPAGLDGLAAGLESVRPWDELGSKALTTSYLWAWDDGISDLLRGDQAPATILERLEEQCDVLRAAHGFTVKKEA